MHLIVVRRDLTGYQHLHPTMAPDGTWSIPLTLPTAGAWRAFADFVATDTGARTAIQLGVDLTVAGSYEPAALPAPANESTVDGFTVKYEGTPQPANTTPLLFRVSRGGTPVVDELQQYLGSYGHLVVLREGDLGYLHVHSETLRMPDGAVRFWLNVPSPGRYRAFLDFQVSGTVHTAQFTIKAG
jgi:hypothetical protein